MTNLLLRGLGLRQTAGREGGGMHRTQPMGGTSDSYGMEFSLEHRNTLMFNVNIATFKASTASPIGSLILLACL